ncbi:MAG: glutamyl-tRNA reductase [Candidatus Omnitrophica bacterium]|nr:glutamyl-tRNA reductase [Candidatus Omnitrophota bacterium]
MRLTVIGINHRTAPVQARERFSFTRSALRESLAGLKHSNLVDGAVILSTCNRIEIYFYPKGDYRDPEKAKSFAFGIFNAEKEDIERYFYIFEGGAAVRHLFRVASGLDSQVLGENQILSQVKSAWTIAKEEGASTAELDEIFTRAQEVGKMVRSETKISQGNISIGSVAIKMLKDRLRNLEGRSALIIGAGKTGALIGKYLKDENMKGIFVASRTYSRALELAADCGGRAVDFTKLEEELRGADIVISSTSSPHIVLKKTMLAKAAQTRKGPLFIMDLAVPRDVDPAARDIDGVTLYDLDDLKCVVEENFKNREREAEMAERLIQKEIEEGKGVRI